MPVLFSIEEYADIIYVYGFCDGNGRAAAREYSRRFPNRRIPNHQTFAAVFNYSRIHGSFPKGKSEREINGVLEDQENVLNIVNDNPAVSTRRIRNQVGIPQSKVWRILKKENLHPYHVQPVQRLQPGDNINRLIFADWIRDHRPTIYRILFTDEAQFTRDGVFNSRNTHIWAAENPHAKKELNSQHKFSVNVWCGILNNHLIGPYFFHERLTGELYLNFLQNILPGMIQNVGIRGIYFQHDGAPPHFSIAVRQYLNNTYPNRWIGRGGPISWPSRAPDFNPVDYFLWGYLKSLVYSENINTREQLIDRIVQSCDFIRGNPDMIRKSVGNLSVRQRKCREEGGFHFENK